ncbi:SCO family protein [Lichenicoccus sp.]|uniref:SCO family protein n=1 Tax=Lichenicoccus sp. TaxID=2781899 RepID=UPI003D0BD628
MNRAAAALSGIGAALLLAAVGLAVIDPAILHPFTPAAGGEQSNLDIGGPFTLTAADGRTVTDADFRGKWMLVYFGYTHCPDACPTALNNIANALDMLKERQKDMAPVFITVDPARDTPDVMGKYVGLFDKQITGLTGTQAQLDIAEQEYRVYAARHAEKNGGYSMDHSSIIYVMDKAGHFSTFIDGAASAEDIAARLRKLDS